MQFHIPSVVQTVPAAIADPEPVVPVLSGVEADATGVEAAAGEASGLEAATGEAAGVEAAALLGATTAGVEVA